MDDRGTLIERAAARLQSGPSRRAEPLTVSEPVDAVSAASAARILPEKSATTAAPLSRKIVLDRGQLARSGITMPWTDTARVVEEFRIIKRNIISSWQLPEGLPPSSRPARVIMVTSARPREGKTFSSINLALAFAAEERFATILIDADSVRGDVAKTLQIDPEPGLTGVLAGELRLSGTLVQTDLPSLVVLPPGAPGPHVPELLSSGAAPNVITEIADRYPNHVIVMDTPPCLASTDPAALASVASQIVFVIEAGHTQRSEIESALNLLSGCQNISFILNLIPVGTSEHFGSYSYYYQPEKR